MSRILLLLLCSFSFSESVAFAQDRSPVLRASAWRAKWTQIEDLVQILGTIPEGKQILISATKRNPEFLSHLHRGNVSMTESTFSRKYSVLDGKEEIFVQHEITINQNLNLADAVVDLAHELTHFTYKELMNPYGENFKAVEFIKNGIESKGGELHALSIECTVAWKLAETFENFPEHSLCEPYKEANGQFNIESAKSDYYSVGDQWKSIFSPQLRRSFPKLSQRKPRFTSSYAKKPYPIALLDEYLATRRAACANNTRKYQVILSKRSLASESTDPLNPELQRLKAYDSRYCQPQESEQHSAANTR